MFKNTIEKFVVATLALGMMVVGVALVPNWAEAKGNSGLHFDSDTNLSIGIGIGQNQLAQNTYKEAVKEAKEDYKDAKKDAKIQLKTSLQASTNQADRIAAVKTYFTSVLTALKAKNASIEAAFQAFINTNFN